MTDVALRRLIAALAVVGAGISSYLVATRLAGAAPVCTSGGCEQVQLSEYSKLFGIPVAALGLGAYLAILVSAFRDAPAFVALGAAVALAGTVFSAYLLVVKVAVIEAVCVWCLASDGVITVLAVLGLLRMRRIFVTSELRT